MPVYSANPDELRLLAMAVVDATETAMGIAATAMALSGDLAPVVGTEPVAAWGQDWSHSLTERADILDYASPIATTVTDANHLAITGSAVDHAFTTATPIGWGTFDVQVSAALAAVSSMLAHQPTTIAAGFLETLDPAVAAAVARRAPEIAGVAGLPVDILFAANRRRIEFAIEDIDHQLGTDPGPDTAVRLAAERETLTGMLGRTFVVFDWAGDGRIAEWVGPTDADHLTVLLPGTGTDKLDVDAMAGNAERMLRVTDGDLAVVTGLVYDAPDFADAILPDAADAGAHELAALVDLLAVDGKHLTLVAHSYGALLLGKALAAGLAADLPSDHDVILIGSVGTGTDHATELGIDPLRLWVGEACDDEVVQAGKGVDMLGNLSGAPQPFGILAAAVEGTLGAKVNSTFGTIPSDPKFGARLFDAGSGGHSGYLDATAQPIPGAPPHWVGMTASMSLAAIIAIATGRWRSHPSAHRKRDTDDEESPDR
ncbi:MAG: hypothetical protein H0V96_10980 [Acidimicrobiia bacterium]|nr:hypothetical protein [Acidimicrobiia bacterium]